MKWNLDSVDWADFGFYPSLPGWTGTARASSSSPPTAASPTPATGRPGVIYVSRILFLVNVYIQIQNQIQFFWNMTESPGIKKT